jgi:hypothetical protein
MRFLFAEARFGLIDAKTRPSKQLSKNRNICRVVASCHRRLEALHSGLRNVQPKHLAEAPLDLAKILTERYILIDNPIRESVAIPIIGFWVF